MLSGTQIGRAERLLGIDPARCVQIPNGFDPTVFERRPLDRVEHWRRHLVAAPQGWAPGAEAGSVAYTDADLAVFEDDAPVLLFVGRFTEVKRVGLLIESFARARERFATRAPLVLLGGFPGEWEGEHPLDTIRRVGAQDVFLAGWHEHEELPDFLSASDAVVLPSVREQFGQVLVEGMACELPALAVDAFGPSDIVDDGDTGWLVPPDDGPALEDGPGGSRQRPRRAPPPRAQRAPGGPRALRLAVAGPAGRGRLRGRRAQDRCVVAASGPGERPSGRIKSPFGPMTAGSQLATVPARQCPCPRPSGAACCRHARDRPSRSACTTPDTSTTHAASRSSRG